MTITALAVLSFILAAMALTRRRLLWGVAVLGAHSLVLAGLYFALAAPDVALTEAAIGFGLVTFVYLLAIRRTGKIVVAAVPCPPLLYPQGEGAAGLFWELLMRLSARTHREIELRWLDRAEVPKVLATSEADLACGDIIPTEAEGRFPQVETIPTRIVLVRWGEGLCGAIRGSREAAFLSGEGRFFPTREALHAALERGEIERAVVNLVELRSLYLSRKLGEAEVEPLAEAQFAVLFAPDEEELARALADVIGELKAGGEWEELLGRHL